MDTILIFDYSENNYIIDGKGKGFGEDYLQVVINNTDTINIDAKEAKRKIKFKHKIFYSTFNEPYTKERPKHIFSRVKFAGLQVIKPTGDSIILHVTTIHEERRKLKRNHDFDTTINLFKVPNNKLVLWNIYDFDAGIGSRPNYFYPRYTLHSHNWPTPAQLARRKKVRRQIERAIVYRYNTVTRQIVKS